MEILLKRLLHATNVSESKFQNCFFDHLYSIVGKSLAYTSIQFTNAKGEIAARGSHTKYVHSARYILHGQTDSEDNKLMIAW